MDHSKIIIAQKTLKMIIIKNKKTPKSRFQRKCSILKHSIVRECKKKLKEGLRNAKRKIRSEPNSSLSMPLPAKPTSVSVKNLGDINKVKIGLNLVKDPLDKLATPTCS